MQQRKKHSLSQSAFLHNINILNFNVTTAPEVCQTQLECVIIIRNYNRLHYPLVRTQHSKKMTLHISQQVSLITVSSLDVASIYPFTHFIFFIAIKPSSMRMEKRMMMSTCQPAFTTKRNSRCCCCRHNYFFVTIIDITIVVIAFAFQ